MGKIADYLKHYSNALTAGGYSSTVYSFLDYIYGKQRNGARVTDDEKGKYEKLVDKYLKSNRNDNIEPVNYQKKFNLNRQ